MKKTFILALITISMFTHATSFAYELSTNEEAALTSFVADENPQTDAEFIQSYKNLNPSQRKWMVAKLFGQTAGHCGAGFMVGIINAVFNAVPILSEVPYLNDIDDKRVHSYSGSAMDQSERAAAGITGGLTLITDFIWEGIDQISDGVNSLKIANYTPKQRIHFSGIKQICASIDVVFNDYVKSPDSSCQKSAHKFHVLLNQK